MLVHPLIWRVSLLASILVVCSCTPPDTQTDALTARLVTAGATDTAFLASAENPPENVPQVQLDAGSSVTFDAAGSSGVPPYRYQWSAPGWAGSTEPNPTLNPTETTTYTLQVTDSAVPPSVVTISVTVIVTNGAGGVTFSPCGGRFDDPVDVQITSATSGATIRYTTNGTSPDSNSGIIYTGPIHLTNSTTVRAAAYKNGSALGPVSSATFTIVPSPTRVTMPRFDPACAEFSQPIDVSITTATQDATLRYTIDGSTPTPTSGIVYTGPFRLTASTTVKAIAYRAGMDDSRVATADYTWQPPLTGTWSALGRVLRNSEDGGAVRALTVYDGKLIAAGEFVSAGGVTANNIAAWDGTSWSALADGLDGSVDTLAVYNGQLIAGGWFHYSGSVPVSCIAAWNGTAWSDLAGGMNSRVYTLAHHNGELVAAGYFVTAGGTSALRVASWNGTRWAAFGSGMPHTVYALASYEGKLVAGGDFWGGSINSNVVVWNGTDWSSMGAVRSTIFGLTVFNDQLIASEGTGGLSRWNGNDWAPMCARVGNPTGFTIYRGMLIANGISAWDGTTWHAIEGSGGSQAVTVYNDQLILGAVRIGGGCNVAAWTMP